MFDDEDRTSTPCGHLMHAECIETHQRINGLPWERCCPFKCWQASAGAVQQQGALARSFSRALRVGRRGLPPAEVADETQVATIDEPEAEAEAGASATVIAVEVTGADAESEQTGVNPSAQTITYQHACGRPPGSTM